MLNIYNLGYNSVGDNPGTGTTSPVVQRVITPVLAGSANDAGNAGNADNNNDNAPGDTP